MTTDKPIEVKLPGATLRLRANVGEPLTAVALVNHLAGGQAIPLDGLELEVDLDAADRRLWITGWRCEASWRAASPVDDSAPDADHEPGLLAGWQRPEFDDSKFYGAMSPAMQMLGPNIRWSWTRTHLFVPEECQGRPLTLVLGSEGVFDLAFTRIYLNGHLVATRTVDPAEPWHELGRFDIGPGSAVGQYVRYGQDNVLALQHGPQIERTSELDAVDPLHVRHLSHRHHYAQYEQYVVVGTERRPVNFRVASVTPADGKGGVVVALESPEGIAAEVRYAANPHGAGVLKTCALRNSSGAALRVLDVRLGRYRTGLNAIGHADVGFPVYVDDQLFATLMHPAGWVRGRDGEVLLEQHPARELKPGDRFACMPALLVPSPPGQARAAFREQVRARMRRVTRGHDRAYAIYESFGAWKPNDTFMDISDEIARRQIACMARAQEETGQTFDAFFMEFWHDINGDVERPDPRRFPEGFANVRRLLAEQKVSLGLWIDSTQGAWNIGGNPAIWPCTTYDHAYAVRRDPSPTQGFSFLCLTADPFRSLMTNGFLHHLRHNGARMFKFDNFNTVCYNPNHGHWPGLYSTEAICNAGIEFLQALDRECPEVFLILYWGWRSPWWLLHGDTLFECGLAMEAASPGDTPTLFVRDGVTKVLDMGQWYATDIPALLTGMAPHNNGMLGLAHLGWGLNDYRQHWVHTLHAAGYTSYFTGGQHISAGGRDGMESNRRIGYQNILEAIGQTAWAERLVKLFAGKPAEPWVAEIGFSDCHRHAQWFPPAQSADDPRFARAPAPLPDEPRTRQEFAGYCSLARQFDLHVGQILGALDTSGLADNTYVILTTDHGIDFPHMKCTLRDDGIGVFLMIRGPRGGAWRGGRIVDALVSHIDVFPTLCEWSGATPPAWLQGHSLTPLVAGTAEAIRDEVQAEINYHAAYQPTRGIRTARWKYIRRFYRRSTPIPPNQAPCHSRDIWEEHDWFRRDEPREELYDLIYDPGEAANLADSPAHAQALAEMRGRLDRWMRTTDDPLLRGHVPLIEGGKTVVWDDPSNHGRTMTAAEWNAWLAEHEPYPDPLAQDPAN